MGRVKGSKNNGAYRYKLLTYDDNRNIINREFFCSQREILDKYENFSTKTIVNLLKDDVGRTYKTRDYQLERCFIPRKSQELYSYDFNNTTNKKEESEDDSSDSELDYYSNTDTSDSDDN